MCTQNLTTFLDFEFLAIKLSKHNKMFTNSTTNNWKSNVAYTKDEILDQSNVKMCILCAYYYISTIFLCQVTY